MPAAERSRRRDDTRPALRGDPVSGRTPTRRRADLGDGRVERLLAAAGEEHPRTLYIEPLGDSEPDAGRAAPVSCPKPSPRGCGVAAKDGWPHSFLTPHHKRVPGAPLKGPRTSVVIQPP